MGYLLRHSANNRRMQNNKIADMFPAVEETSNPITQENQPAKKNNNPHFICLIISLSFHV
jgi:hypothetical protein